MNMVIRQHKHAPARRTQQGLSLIELMIAMLLGLLVVGAAGGVFLSNKRVYGSSETLGRIQENQRTAFELMSRDLREAGGNPCGSASTLVYQISQTGHWNTYADGLKGYAPNEAATGTAFGSAATQRVQGTDAVDLYLANDAGIRVTLHDNPSAVLKVNSTNGLALNDVVMVCNMDYSFIFQVTGLPSGEIQHQGGGSLNCAQEFQWQAPCLSGGASGANGYCFMVSDPTDPTVNSNCSKFSTSPAEVVKITTSRWYIGNNGRGGRSLYRAILAANSATATLQLIGTEEIAEGVTGMGISYRVAGNSAYQTAAQVQAANAWKRVIAARVTMQFSGTPGALQGAYIEGTDGNALTRTVSNDVALRNREHLQ